MNRRHLLATGMAAAALFPSSGLLFAQTAPTPIDAEKLPALLGGNFSIATSQLARTRALNESARVFAALEISEQAAVAAAFGAAPGEAGMREDHAAMVAALDAAEGAAFDAMYIEGQIAGHEELLGIHRTYAANGTDPQARGASIVGVTGIESHLAMLRGIQLQLG